MTHQDKNATNTTEDFDETPEAGQALTSDQEATPGQPPPEDLSAVRAELEAARERLREVEDQLLRRAAEFQNYRRRTQEDLAFAAERGRREVILRMIEVLDDLWRSREAAERAAEHEKAGPLFETLKHGVDLVYQKFEDALAAFGVAPIAAVGQPFDERLHEALLQEPADGAAPGTVVSEIRKGYMMGERVLRHAQVVVAQ